MKKYNGNIYHEKGQTVGQTKVVFINCLKEEKK
jgi:hypothetical protein